MLHNNKVFYLVRISFNLLKLNILFFFLTFNNKLLISKGNINNSYRDDGDGTRHIFNYKVGYGSAVSQN